MKIKERFHRKRHKEITAPTNRYVIEMNEEGFNNFCSTLAEAGRALDAKYKAEPKLDRVVFSGPATICFWSDGTKTIAKQSKYDYYDKEKGLCVALLKKYMGSAKVIKTIQKYCGED